MLYFSVFRKHLQDAVRSCAVPGRGKQYDVSGLCAMIREAYKWFYTMQNAQASFHLSGI